MRDPTVDVVLLHRGRDMTAMVSIHLVVDGERRVFTEPLDVRTLARLVASGAELLAADVATWR